MKIGSWGIGIDDNVGLYTCSLLQILETSIFFETTNSFLMISVSAALQHIIQE